MKILFRALGFIFALAVCVGIYQAGFVRGEFEMRKVVLVNCLGSGIDPVACLNYVHGL